MRPSTTSAGASRAATSTATVGPTWRSAFPGGSWSRSSTAATPDCCSGRRDTLGNRGFGSGVGRYGHRLAAGDFNRDGFADLAVGAPGEDVTAPATGAIELLFGSPDGLTTERARTIRRPDDSYVGFGRRLATGHVNGDRNLDLVEGAPDEPEGQPGHGSFCRGTVRGPFRCQRLGDSGTSNIAVADVTGDGFEDIVQGDHVESPGPGLLAEGGGEVRLWRGGRARA